MTSTKNKNRAISIIEFSELNWKQIDELPKEKTVFFLPISPMEEHGPHLPVGTDFLTAKDTAKDAVKELGKNHKDITCVLLPPVPLGFCKFNTDFPGSISVSSRVVREVIISFGSALAKHGFFNDDDLYIPYGIKPSKRDLSSDASSKEKIWYESM